MKTTAIAILTLLVFSLSASADIPDRPRTAVQEAIAPHGGQGARDFCSVVYYDYCSGWIWIYSGWAADDRAGVVFDLPTDCGFLSGASVWNTHFWWYWRYTQPNRGFSVSYDLYEVDGNGCLIEPPVGSLDHYEPVERWNRMDGLGSVSTSKAALVATWDSGALPYFVTDNNGKNYAAPGACPGFAVRPPHTYRFGDGTTTYCPPVYFADGWGPVQCLMDAGWDAPTGTEAASWSAIKKMFD